MRSLEDIGLLVLIFGCGWVTWKFLEPRYQRAKEEGGPEWVRMERLTVWAVIGGALIGGMSIGAILVWLDSR
jgi:hypothetical protein